MAEDVTPFVTITMISEVGSLIAATDSRSDVEPAGLPPGKRTARFFIDELPLQEGRFLLNISLQSENGIVLHNRENVARFAVIAQSPGYGPVRLDGGWQISTHAGA